MSKWPNKSLQPTPVGVVSSADAGLRRCSGVAELGSLAIIAPDI